jgi:hypothetical protein
VRKMKLLTLVLSMFILSSCAAVRVTQDYEISTNFNQYRTFSLAPEKSRINGGALMESPLMEKRIRTAVESIMKEQGYPKVADTQSDFYVTYQFAVRTRIEVDTIPDYGWRGYPYGYRHYRYPYWGGPYWRGPYWHGWDYEPYVRQYEEGTLIIDFIDSNTRTLFWRGAGSRRLSGVSTPEDVTEWINRLVSEILAQYPPIR